MPMRNSTEGGFSLSPRQVQMLDLLVEGYRDKEIAKKLGISTNTVKNTLTIVRLKTKSSNRLDLALKYARSAWKRDATCLGIFGPAES